MNCHCQAYISKAVTNQKLMLLKYNHPLLIIYLTLAVKTNIEFWRKWKESVRKGNFKFILIMKKKQEVVYKV